MRWICALWIWTTAAWAEPVVVFAAASLKEPLDALTADTGFVISYGGSGTLARQITQGAPADAVVLANAAWMQVLQDAGHATNPAQIASNSLVIIAPKDAPDLALTAEDLRARLTQGPFAIGFVGAVPAGIYGQQALTSLGLWDTVSPHIAQVDNVRAALALVARGEAPLGIVYATDAAASDAVRIVATLPASSHDKIRYMAANITPQGTDFLKLLLGPQGRAAFGRAGFLAVAP